MVSKGVYDVYVAGNLAYATVLYADQEDKPAQTIVEIIDLEKLDDPTLDATIPTMVNRYATQDDFAARDLTWLVERFRLQLVNKVLSGLSFYGVGGGESFTTSGADRYFHRIA